jgi:hypothetical protein
MSSDWHSCMQPGALRDLVQLRIIQDNKDLLPIDVVRCWSTRRIARNTIGYPSSLVDPDVVNIHGSREDEMFPVLRLEVRRQSKVKDDVLGRDKIFGKVHPRIAHHRLL